MSVSKRPVRPIPAGYENLQEDCPSGAKPGGEEADQSDQAPPPPPHTRWPEKTHKIFGEIPFTAEDPRAPTPAGFVGTLWAPQATILQAMLDLEARPVLNLESTFTLDEHGATFMECRRRLEVRAARIAEKFSFGKTILTTGLICASRCPKAYPAPLILPIMDSDQGSNRLAVQDPQNQTARAGHTFAVDGRGVVPTIRQTYQRLIRATLVIAASSVISQWEDILARFAPGLRAYTIDNVRAIRAFAEAAREPGDLPYDVVLMKAGRVTTSYAAPGEPPLAGKQRPITSALRAATRGFVWARVVIDDYDTVAFTADDILPQALFTWVISATRRKSTALINQRAYHTGATPEEYLRKNEEFPILGFSLNAIFEKSLKLRCEAAYVDAHISTTRITFRRITVAGGNAVRLLQDLGIPSEILEMAAAGAVETAAERLGIKAASVGDLVERVLRKRTDRYRQAAWTLARLERVREALRVPGRPPAPPEIAWGAQDIIENGTDEEFGAFLGALGPSSLAALGPACRAVEGKAAKARDKYGGQLQRMRSNIREGECQACMLPFDDGDPGSYIVNCCQITICSHCAVAAGGRAFIARCPNCAKDVHARTDLIFISADLGASLDAGLLDEGQARLAGPPGPSAAGAQIAKTRKEFYAQYDDDPRLRGLLQLLFGDEVDSLDDKEVEPFVQGLLEGRRDVPAAAGAPKKILIAAMHSESTRKIGGALAAAKKEQGLPGHVVLQGTRQQRDQVVAEFKNPAGPAIMLLTSSTSCSGLHLPEVTDFVEYHHHADIEVAGQLVGRAQRVGRSANLSVIVFVSEGEVDRLW